MFSRKGLARVAACAALACGGIVRAADSATASDEGLVLRPVYLQQDATQPGMSPERTTTSPATSPSQETAATAPSTPLRPLMGLLEQTPVGKALDSYNITIGGYVEGGFTASTSRPPGSVITGRVFDTRNEHVVLDQWNFFFDRPVDYAKAAQNHTIDIGGHLDLIYGFDTGLIHSNGIYDNPATLGVTKGFYASRTDPENQFDINQAYIDVALPVGTGLRIRAGKFVTLLGEEVINPTGNALYSHSYLFGFAIPFTQTGIMGEYKINDDWLVDGGITRGWNQSINDNNGDPDLLAGVTYTPQESDFLKKWKFIANLSEGPQATGDNSDWWTVIDLQAYYTVNDKLSVSVNGDYGDAPHGLAPKSAQWWGLAGYASYILNPMFTLNGRIEWYEDNNGFTFGTGTRLNAYEATVGTAIKPFPTDNLGQNLVIRPEIRFDYADKAFFDAGTDHYQFTFGIDAYFTY
jgi:hypothetical protein